MKAVRRLAERIRNAWARLSPSTQSVIRHAALAFVVAFVATARHLLPAIVDVRSLSDVSALVSSAVIAALAAGARAALSTVRAGVLKALRLPA